MKINPKLAASSLTATIVGMITWLLVSYVPTFHHGLPVDLANLLPGLVGIAVGFVGGYLKREESHPSELVARVEAAAATIEHLVESLINAGKNPPANPAA